MERCVLTLRFGNNACNTVWLILYPDNSFSEDKAKFRKVAYVHPSGTKLPRIKCEMKIFVKWILIPKNCVK